MKTLKIIVGTYFVLAGFFTIIQMSSITFFAFVGGFRPDNYESIMTLVLFILTIFIGVVNVYMGFSISKLLINRSKVFLLVVPFSMLVIILTGLVDNLNSIQIIYLLIHLIIMTMIIYLFRKTPVVAPVI